MTTTLCPCGKPIDVGPTCQECAPAYRAGMIAGLIAVAREIDKEYNIHSHALLSILGGHIRRKIDAICKEINP